MSRCTNTNTKDAHLYTDKGIKVCERWHVFENFLADMGERPENMTLDRIDSNKDYEPSNCRWATRLEQTRNNSATKLTLEKATEIVYRAIKFQETDADLGEAFGVHRRTVNSIVRKDTWKDAFPIACKQLADELRL